MSPIQWRYVHIDDRLPCRMSGRIHFCRNVNPNETFAMLFEKAYAKLHGCYEAIVYGSVDVTLRDMMPAAHVGTIKCDRIPPEGEDIYICNDTHIIVWSYIYHVYVMILKSLYYECSVV